MPALIELVVNSLGVGGAERHSVAIANALHAHGFAVRVVALSGNRTLRDELHPIVAADSFAIERRGGFDAMALGRYRRLVSAKPPALTMTVNLYPLIFVSAATLWMGTRQAPVLHVSHTTELPHEDTTAKRLMRSSLRRRPQARVYVCEHQRAYWRARGHDGEDHCIHNGVDIERFAPVGAERRRELRASLAVPEDALLIGLCAGLRIEKRHDLLLDAVAQARRNGLRVHALFIGDGPLRARIVAHAQALGVADAITITGFQNDVRPWLGACDASCLVSDHETFSLAILEGMAMGLPVIATRVGAVEEQIIHDEDGLLTPAGDAAALADSFARLVDPAERQRLGLRARAKVVASFDARTMSARFVALVAQSLAS